MNKYEKWYELITKRGQHRKLDSYTEKHHILPESLGGLDTPENLTTLTAREHFICHWLLTKIYKEGEAHWKMLNAIRMMRAENKNQQRYSTKITSRVYSNLKEEYSRLQSERVCGQNNPMYGKVVSESVRKGRSERAKKDNPSKREGIGLKISRAKTGVKREQFSDEWRVKMSAAKLGENNSMYGKTHKQSTLNLMRQKAIGRKQSQETISKKADAIRGLKREKKLCPHCNTSVAVNGYARWHGDNCKNNPLS
jgi:NUMOD3 motif